jgi:3-deoxy-manno-octulosonate cytidylyltransferase (CMP-KDO synthetase)
MNPAIVIPARWKSSRFPGKPLALIAGRPMLDRVYERCSRAIDPSRVFIATDSERIRAHCDRAGMRVVMTSESCLTGTDRVHEASSHIDADVYINVQGDEPLIEPADIRAVLLEWQAHPGAVVNAMCRIAAARDYLNRNVPKVVSAPDGRLLYMSRAPIPTDKDGAFCGGMRQVCVYAFPREALARFAMHGEKTPLERIEDIEILRFIELGIDVRMLTVGGASLAVDIPEDIERVEAAIRDRGEE